LNQNGKSNSIGFENSHSKRDPRLEIVARTDTGKVRTNNEDVVAYDVHAGVAVLADGMGGLAAGEVASRIAVESTLRLLRATERRDEPTLIDTIRDANLAVRTAASGDGQMGTTLVVWALTPLGQCFVGHVGDSRAYRLRAGNLQRMTTDHSLVQQLVNDGVLSEAEAATAPNRNVITRAIGLEEQVEAEVRSWVYSPGDVFLLCSDGLTDLISEPVVEEILNAQLTEPEAALDSAADRLIRRANDAGGYDNISVILIRPA
jgi:serine/threonine protein phosphatase PrpC